MAARRKNQENKPVKTCLAVGAEHEAVRRAAGDLPHIEPVGRTKIADPVSECERDCKTPITGERKVKLAPGQSGTKNSRSKSPPPKGKDNSGRRHSSPCLTMCVCVCVVGGGGCGHPVQAVISCGVRTIGSPSSVRADSWSGMPAK